MTLTDKVRTATHSLHHALDQAMMPYIAAIRSKEDYAALLLAFYGFFKPVYDNIDTYIDTSFLPDYKNRRRPEWILHDLDAMEVEYTLPVCGQLPLIKDNASAFGALYVLEGSTMGGVMIKKMIGDKLQRDSGFSFFYGYGRQTREQWNAFIEAFNQLDKHNSADNEVVETAAATFVLFKDWLQQCRLSVLQD